MHVSIVDAEIPSLDTKCVTGHHEDLGVTDVCSPTNLPKLVSDGKKIHKLCKILGVSHSVVHPYARYPAFPGGLQTKPGSQLDKGFRQWLVLNPGFSLTLAKRSTSLGVREDGRAVGGAVCSSQSYRKNKGKL